MLKKYDLNEIMNIVNEKYFKDEKKQSFLEKEHKEHFDEDWDEIEEEMLNGIDQIKHSKAFIKEMSIVSDLNFDKNNFDEKIKIKVVIFDGKKDFNFDYYLHVRSIQNLKDDKKDCSKFIEKCYFIEKCSQDKIQNLLNDIIKECKFNIGLDDIKDFLGNYFILE